MKRWSYVCVFMVFLSQAKEHEGKVSAAGVVGEKGESGKFNSVECLRLVEALRESGAVDAEASRGTTWTECLRRLAYWRDKLPETLAENRRYARQVDEGRRRRAVRNKVNVNQVQQSPELVLRLSKFRDQKTGAYRFYTIVKKRKRKNAETTGQPPTLPESENATTTVAPNTEATILVSNDQDKCPPTGKSDSCSEDLPSSTKNLIEPLPSTNSTAIDEAFAKAAVEMSTTDSSEGACAKAASVNHDSTIDTNVTEETPASDDTGEASVKTSKKKHHHSQASHQKPATASSSISRKNPAFIVLFLLLGSVFVSLILLYYLFYRSKSKHKYDSLLCPPDSDDEGGRVNPCDNRCMCDRQFNGPETISMTRDSFEAAPRLKTSRGVNARKKLHKKKKKKTKSGLCKPKFSESELLEIRQKLACVLKADLCQDCERFENDCYDHFTPSDNHDQHRPLLQDSVPVPSEKKKKKSTKFKLFGGSKKKMKDEYVQQTKYTKDGCCNIDTCPNLRGKPPKGTIKINRE